MPEEKQPELRLRHVAAIQDHQALTALHPTPTSNPPRIYLAGPMTGLPEFNYPVFQAEAARLRQLGYHVENPAENPTPACGTWPGYMRNALAQLVTCDTIALLPGWMNSKGARLEFAVATTLGMRAVDVDQVSACPLELKGLHCLYRHRMAAQ